MGRCLMYQEEKQAALENGAAAKPLRRNRNGLLPEIPLQQACESLAVPRFVAADFMHDVMDGVEVQRLGLLGQVGAALGGAVFGVGAEALISLIF